MRESREHGSVGGLGGKPPRPTRLASGKLEEGGRVSNSETFRCNPAGSNPARQSLAWQPEASLAWGGATLTAKRRQ